MLFPPPVPPPQRGEVAKGAVEAVGGASLGRLEEEALTFVYSLSF